jgi:hypothetical protein
MANYFLVLGTLAGFGWLFVNAPPPPSAERTAPLPASRAAAIDSPAPPAIIPASRSPTLEAHRAPVPLVRNVRVSPAPSASDQTQAAAAEQPAQDDLNKRAAKVAVEADGYKGVVIVGKASNGAWRAKGYRGTTEVMLTVDGTGRVSMD